ncbi:MAG: hypothetical protein ACMUIU_07215 [bacterium]
MKRINKKGLSIVFVTILAMILVGKAVSSDFVKIPRPDGADTIDVLAINNNGQVVGFYATSSDDGMFISAIAFKWVDGEMITLPLPEGKNVCHAFDINEDGDVVGYCYYMSEEGWFEDFIPFLWTEEGVSDLSEKVGSGSTAIGINNLGHIVGDIFTDYGQRAYFLMEEELTELGILWECEDPYSCGSVAYAVNYNDKVVGFSWKWTETEGFISRAFTWTQSEEKINLGVLPGYELSQGFGINDNGDVIGVCGNLVCDEFGVCWAGNAKAFLFTNETGMTQLGMLSGKNVSMAYGINNQGIIVGANAYETEENILEDETAVVWKPEPVALSEITGEPGLLKASDINDSGQIIGTAFSQDLGQYAFLWTPEIKVREVQIDIKPGGEPNCINKAGYGFIPVAVFGAADFDVANINLESLKLQDVLEIGAVGKQGVLLAHLEDVNGDGHEDLIAKFANMEGIFSDEDTTGILTGSLNDGTPIKGMDSICIVP